MQFSVMEQNQIVGSCSVERVGLYWQLRCRCRPKMTGILRLYTGMRCVGVLEPEDDALCLSRKLSCSGWPELPPRDSCFRLSPASPMEHWQGTVLDQTLTGGFFRREGEESVLLFPFAEDNPCPCIPLLCFFSIADGFWQLRLNKHGQPFF